MLERLLHFYRRFSAWLLPVEDAAGYCSISFLPHEIELVYARDVNGKRELQLLETISYRKNKNPGYLLANAVKNFRLENVPCFLVLRPPHFQILVIEALPVTESEFQAAIRWKIKDFLEFPIEDAVIDSFPIPLQKVPGANKMIGVVVARASYLKPIVNTIRASGLKLSTIDVCTLALHNITALYEDDQKTTALIYFQEHHSELIITRQKLLFFHRYFDFGLDAIKTFSNNVNDDTSNVQLDKVALELQRSFDFYQSQWREPLPARVFLATTKLSAQAIASYLSRQLAVTIDPLKLGDLVTTKKELSIETQGRYLPLIGSVLKEEINENATTN